MGLENSRFIGKECLAHSPKKGRAPGASLGGGRLIHALPRVRDSGTRQTRARGLGVGCGKNQISYVTTRAILHESEKCQCPVGFMGSPRETSLRACLGIQRNDKTRRGCISVGWVRPFDFFWSDATSGAILHESNKMQVSRRIHGISAQNLA